MAKAVLEAAGEELDFGVHLYALERLVVRDSDVLKLEMDALERDRVDWYAAETGDWPDC